MLKIIYIILSIKQFFSYLFIEESKSFVIKTRDKNKRTNLGNIYFDNKYIIIIIVAKVKVISFIK